MATKLIRLLTKAYSLWLPMHTISYMYMFTMFTHVIVAIDIYFIYKSKIVIEVVGIQLGCHTLESTHDWDTCQKINRKYKCITVF